MKTYGQRLARHLLALPPIYDLARPSDLYFGTETDGNRQPVYVPTSALDTHMHVVGQSGGGKTRLECEIGQQVIDSNQCSFWGIDPHGGGNGVYHSLKAHCYRTCPDRLITIDVRDVDALGYAAGFNPLQRGQDPGIQADIGTQLLKAVSGDMQGFAPMLEVWGFNLFLSMILGELAMADASTLLCPTRGEVLRSGLPLVVGESYPDVADYWQGLLDRMAGGGRRATDIFDATLGSTLRRVGQYVRNERLRAMLNTRLSTIDMQEVLEKKLVVLVNLQVDGTFSESNASLFGRQLIHEVIRTSMSQTGTPKELFLMIDEFHNFLSPDISQVLDGGRKYGIRALLAHQHLQQLEQVLNDDWRIYHSVLQIPCKVVFGGLPPSDLEVLAKLMHGPFLDIWRVKQEQKHTTQTHHLELLDSTSQTDSYGDAIHSGSARSRTVNQAEHDQATDGIIFDRERSGYTDGLAATTMDSFGHQRNENHGQTRSQSWVAVPDAPEVQIVKEWMPLTEQLHEVAMQMQTQPKQHATLQTGRHRPIVFRVADNPPPRITLAELTDYDRERFPGLPWAAPLAQIEEEAKQRLLDFQVRCGFDLPEQDLDYEPIRERSRADVADELRRRAKGD